MRKCDFCKIGLAIAGVGALILLALILPPAAWWFALGIALIAAGIVICKKK